MPKILIRRNEYIEAFCLGLTQQVAILQAAPAFS